MNMREKMARAIRPHVWDYDDLYTQRVIDAVLDALMEPTQSMLAVAHDNTDWYGGMQGHNESEERALLEMWRAALTVAKEGR